VFFGVMNGCDVIIVGGGPAGMMAAIRASELGARVLLLEKNPQLGRKLLLTGKGRCNVTNACSLNDFLKRFSKNGNFLRDAFKFFFNDDLMEFFEDSGLKLKVERQKRVFPETDRASSVLNVLKDTLSRNHVQVVFDCPVAEIQVENQEVFGVKSADGRLFKTSCVILATGGVTYKETGSTGDGLEIAKGLGHHIVALRPGLVALESREHFPKLLEGLTLKNIALEFSNGNSTIQTEIGEMVFTYNGVSGPLVISASSQVADWLREGLKVTAMIDLKPGMDRDQIDKRLLKEFHAFPKKSIKTVFKELLPMRMVDVFLNLAGLDIEKKANQVTQAERQKCVELFKKVPLGIVRTAPFNTAMVTQGGISLKEVNPRTMESRLIKGLYFAGEILDIDGDTGGFNLQAAFSSGYLAGQTTAQEILGKTH